MSAFQVFLPALSHNQFEAESSAFTPDTEQADMEHKHLTEADLAAKKEEHLAASQSFQIMRNEFLMNMQKFLSHIQRTIQQIEGKYFSPP